MAGVITVGVSISFRSIALLIWRQLLIACIWNTEGVCRVMVLQLHIHSACACYATEVWVVCQVNHLASSKMICRGTRMSGLEIKLAITDSSRYS